MTLYCQYLSNTPVGDLEIIATHKAITAIRFLPGAGERTPDSRPSPLTAQAERELNEYFSGQRTRFELPLAPIGTEFQQACWQALQAIPYGQTASYADQAAVIQRPRAVRAVGAANGANPLPIVIPCHRVIGKNGQLTGYAGGMARKQWLLAHERGQVG
ncbi:methylated-DNA--[protein]-cysteine S-methyltransferase [Natronospirillum operosum]|uniref:Methylated-DNA--protein-cysteine methyltransferase n=1 Tax=Natronospirillum operosum TaxID=2759953 RepID=A0A4Z0W773_9GAMM|nr:methylated-DNA--[protein]-cysteine S-methyltransferase [Natronospirillum operosum]TGG93217.1 methylated-DNA--[protein]-cysteine S-methyltransferase [Natronospirillum operosum]